jgi:hypothetical protein
VVVARSETSYLLAPALSGRAVSWLEYPAGRARSVDAAWRRAGDRLLVADGRGRHARVMYDGGCRGDAGCASAGAPSVSGDRAVFSVAAAADGSGYLAAARPGSNLTWLLVRGEDGQRGPGVYAAGAGAAVWALDANVLSRPLTDDSVLAMRISAAEATGGRVFAVARAARLTAWVARSGAGQQVVVAPDDEPSVPLLAETRPGWRIGSLAVLGDGSIAIVQLFQRGARRRAVLTLLRAGGGITTLASSDALKGGPTYAPRVSGEGSLVTFRRRARRAGAMEDALLVIDVASGRRGVIARAPLKQARLADAALGGGRIAWAETKLRRRSFAGSRILMAPARRALR